MTKINKNKQSENVQMHNGVVIFDLLDRFLPKSYASEAVRRLSLKGLDISKDAVRNTRHDRYSTFKNQILAVLLEMANEEKAAIEALNSTVTK